MFHYVAAGSSRACRALGIHPRIGYIRLGRARGRPRLPAVLGDTDGAAHAVIAAYDGVTIQLLLDKDVERARGRLRQLLTAPLTDGSGTPRMNHHG